jgi:flagellar biogenesis protein FliO
MRAVIVTISFIFMMQLCASANPLRADAIEILSETAPSSDTRLSDTRRGTIAEELAANPAFKKGPNTPLDFSSDQGDEPATQRPWMAVLKALGVCIGSLFLFLGLYRKFVMKNSHSLMSAVKILDKIPLTAKTNLIVAEFRGRELLLSVGPDRVTRICPVEDVAEVIAAPQHFPTNQEDHYEMVCEHEIKLSA